MVEAFKIIGGKKIAGELKVDGSKNSIKFILLNLIYLGKLFSENIKNYRSKNNLLRKVKT